MLAIMGMSPHMDQFRARDQGFGFKRCHYAFDQSMPDHHGHYGHHGHHEHQGHHGDQGNRGHRDHHSYYGNQGHHGHYGHNWGDTTHKIISCCPPKGHGPPRGPRGHYDSPLSHCGEHYNYRECCGTKRDHNSPQGLCRERKQQQNPCGGRRSPRGRHEEHRPPHGPQRDHGPTHGPHEDCKSPRRFLGDQGAFHGPDQDHSPPHGSTENHGSYHHSHENHGLGRGSRGCPGPKSDCGPPRAPGADHNSLHDYHGVNASPCSPHGGHRLQHGPQKDQGSQSSHRGHGPSCGPHKGHGLESGPKGGNGQPRGPCGDHAIPCAPHGEHGSHHDIFGECGLRGGHGPKNESRGDCQPSGSYGDINKLCNAREYHGPEDGPHREHGTPCGLFGGHIPKCAGGDDGRPQDFCERRSPRGHSGEHDPTCSPRIAYGQTSCIKRDQASLRGPFEGNCTFHGPRGDHGIPCGRVPKCGPKDGHDQLGGPCRDRNFRSALRGDQNSLRRPDELTCCPQGEQSPPCRPQINPSSLHDPHSGPGTRRHCNNSPCVLQDDNHPPHDSKGDHSRLRDDHDGHCPPKISQGDQGLISDHAADNSPPRGLGGDHGVTPSPSVNHVPDRKISQLDEVQQATANEQTHKADNADVSTNAAGKPPSTTENQHQTLTITRAA